jgi:hypothetical protein
MVYVIQYPDSVRAGSVNFWNLFLEWNSTCFGQFLCPSSGFLHCTHSNGMSYSIQTVCEQDQLISQINSWEWNSTCFGQFLCPSSGVLHCTHSNGMSYSIQTVCEQDQLISQIYSWELKTTCFEKFLCPSSGVFHRTHSNGICHTALQTACEQDQDGTPWNSILIPLASYQQTCMTYNIVVCTVKISCWWTEELSETCTVLFQNKFEKLLHLVGYLFTFMIQDARSHEIKILADTFTRVVHGRCTRV